MRSGFWVPPSKSCRAECSNRGWPQEVLPFMVLQLLLRSHWKSRGWRASRPIFCFQESCSPLHLPCLRRLWSGSGFFHPCSKRLGIQALCWPSEEASETTPDVLGWLAPMGQTSFCSLLRQPTNHFENKGCSGGKDAKLEKSKCLEGEFPPHIGSQVDVEGQK